LFQDRLSKLAEHAAHVDMIIGAVAQHDAFEFIPLPEQ
jgi:hypothetical protein